MAAIDDIRGNQIFHGVVNFAGTCTLPDQTVDDAAVKQAAAIAATKLQHQHPLSAELAEQDTAVADIQKLVHISRVSGEIVDMRAAVITVATGADRTATVQLHKSTGGGAFATVLTTAVVLDDDSTVLVPIASVIDSTKSALVIGDILKLIVTVAGSAAAQAKGLIATITLRENAS